MRIAKLNPSLSCTTLALLLFSLPAHAVRDAVVDQAAEHLRANQAAAAFTLLDPLEVERAGDIDFDLALGVASNQTAHYTRAIMALERAEKNAPDNARVKTELASAYFAVRDTKRAKEQLIAAKAQGVPTEVAGTIDQFMREIDRIDTNKAPSRFNHTGYISFGLGYDNNASKGPNDKLIPVPIFGTTLWMTPAVQSQESSYYSLNGGFSGRYTLTPEWSWVGSADYGLNNNLRNIAKPFDAQNLSLATGPMWRKERHEISLLASYGQQWQGGAESATSNGFVGSWVYRFDGFRQVSTYIQYSSNRYDQNANANAKRTIIGSTYSHMLRNGLFGFAGVYAGKEKPTSQLPVLQHLGNDIYGLRAGVQYNLRPDLGIYASLNYEDRQFDGVQPTFGQVRHDKQTSLNMGVNWVPAPYWRISPAINWQDSDSNLPLFRVKHKGLSVTARREF
jgi:hypothetical protein